jgi:hypothetical protein
MVKEGAAETPFIPKTERHRPGRWQAIAKAPFRLSSSGIDPEPMPSPLVRVALVSTE